MIKNKTGKNDIISSHPQQLHHAADAYVHVHVKILIRK